MKSLSISYFILFFGFTMSAQYTIESTPKWVKETSPEVITSIDKNIQATSSGYNLSVSDYQYNLAQNASYVRRVLNVVSISGITEASQLSVTIDTSYHKLVIHHVLIWRKGERIDRTIDAEFKILNKEDKLESGLYYGKATIYSNLEDIRKGDLIDFSYSILGENPIFNDEKFLFFPLEDDFPVDYYYFRAVYDASQNYQYKCMRCDSSILLETSIEGKYKEIAVLRKNLKKYEQESNLPSGFISFPYIMISSMNNWKDVGEWAKGVFQLEKDPNLDEVFSEIFTGGESQDEKINKVINYVQDEIRYMGIESGIGSIKPFHPNTVVKRRFGDCKDKSNLLVHLLKKIGVENAYPVLVNSKFLNELSNMLPSNQIFDHCIVRFDYQDSIYYLDPTMAQQGGNYTNTEISDYGKVLVVGLESDSLKTMNFKNQNKTIFRDEYHIKSFIDPITIEMQSIRNGLNADTKRLYMEVQPKEEIINMITNDLKVKYTGIKELEDPRCNDNALSNEIVCNYKFSIDKVWKDGNELKSSDLKGYWYFHFEPISLYQLLNDYDCKKRIYPYGLPFPFETEFDYIFHFPKEILIIDDHKKWVTPAFTIHKHTKQLGENKVQITYNYKIKNAEITPDELEKVCSQKENIGNEQSTIFYFKK